MSDGTQPVFPPELERQIILLSFHNDRDNAHNVILVAQRVYEWLLPELFKVVVYRETGISNQSKDWKLSPSKTVLIRHGRHVRHLVLSDLDDQVGQAECDSKPEWRLFQCPNVIDLALWNCPQTFFPAFIDQLCSLRHLTHLSFKLADLESGLSTFKRELPHPFTTVTHLQLLHMMYEYDPKKIKTLFPSVTHLALVAGSYPVPEPNKFWEVLNMWGDRLEVLAWSPGPGAGSHPQVVPTHHYSLIKDPRIVALLYGSDWIDTWLRDQDNGVMTEGGFWRTAEDAVRDHDRSDT